MSHKPSMPTPSTAELVDLYRRAIKSQDQVAANAAKEAVHALARAEAALAEARVFAAFSEGAL